MSVKSESVSVSELSTISEGSQFILLARRTEQCLLLLHMFNNNVVAFDNYQSQLTFMMHCDYVLLDKSYVQES